MGCSGCKKNKLSSNLIYKELDNRTIEKIIMDTYCI